MFAYKDFLCEIIQKEGSTAFKVIMIAPNSLSFLRGTARLLPKEILYQVCCSSVNPRMQLFSYQFLTLSDLLVLVIAYILASRFDMGFPYTLFFHLLLFLFIMFCLLHCHCDCSLKINLSVMTSFSVMAFISQTLNMESHFRSIIIKF